MQNFLNDEEVEKLESCAQSSTVPQLWSADGGEPMTITDIVRNRGKTKDKSGKLFHPKKWKPVGLSDMVNKWKPKGNADDK
jgi:hypothetical protein